MAHELDKLVSPCKKLKLDTSNDDKLDNKEDGNDNGSELVVTHENGMLKMFTNDIKEELNECSVQTCIQMSCEFQTQVPDIRDAISESSQIGHVVSINDQEKLICNGAENIVDSSLNVTNMCAKETMASSPQNRHALVFYPDNNIARKEEMTKLCSSVSVGMLVTLLEGIASKTARTENIDTKQKIPGTTINSICPFDMDNGFESIDESSTETETYLSNSNVNKAILQFTNCVSSCDQEIEQCSTEIENFSTEQAQDRKSQHIYEDNYFCEIENHCELEVDKFEIVDKCFEISDKDEVYKCVDINNLLDDVSTDADQVEQETKVAVEYDDQTSENIDTTIANIDSRNDGEETCVGERVSPDGKCEKVAATCLHPYIETRLIDNISESFDQDVEAAQGNPCNDDSYICGYPLLETCKPLDNNNRSVPLCTSTPHAKFQDLRIRNMNLMKVESSNEKLLNRIEVPVKFIDTIDFKENMNGEYHLKVKSNMDAADSVKSSKHLKRSSFKKNRESKREKRNSMRTKVEKFKEYMGPGLTVGINGNYVVDTNTKDFVKNTDIETCTLTEYKGFGLTGPLPDKPVKTSTHCPVTSTACPPPALSQMCSNTPNELVNIEGLKVNHDIKENEECQKLTKYISKNDIINNVAGSEGLLPPNIGQVKVTGKAYSVEPVKAVSSALSNATKHNSGSSNPCTTGENIKSALFLTKYKSEQLKQYLSQLPVLKPQSQSLGYLMSQHPLTYKAAEQVGLSEKPVNSNIISQRGPSSSVQPDEEHPGVKNASKKDKSDSTNNADKSDKSEKCFDPKLLQCLGHLKISAYMNFGLLTVHVIQAKQLSTKWKSACDSFVKLSLIPDDGMKPKCKTDLIQGSNNPMYDEKFSFELTELDHSKRLMISIWHRDQSANMSEFLGCMSFGIHHLTNPKKDISGWYYLLTEDIGRKKHLQVTNKQKPQLKNKYQATIPSVNKDVWGTESLTLTLHRGKNGFGFSVVEACPVRVGRIDRASPSEFSGLQPGDIIIRLNKQNVSRSTATSVAKLIKHCSDTLNLEIQRSRIVAHDHLEDSPWKPRTDEVASIHNNPDHSSDHTVPQMFTLNEGTISVDEETLFHNNPDIACLATSTPLPLLARGHRTVPTCDVRKQEAVRQLLNLELDFIDQMHAGMQRYSRPLRHCILSHSQHMTLFQNIEKLTTISEYHVKQMHDNVPPTFVSEDDTDASESSDNHNFFQSIGLIYQSKVHMLCQAYDLYAKGIKVADQLLSELRRNEDFIKYIRDPALQDGQLSISAFISRPVQHICDLYRVLQEVFLNTNAASPDYNSLKQVVDGLQECVTIITNYSCQHVRSLSSLASRGSKVSCTGSSIKSKSSSATSCSSGSCKGYPLQTSNRSVNQEVMKVQDRLVFASNVPIFQLCQDGRHLIFSGDMYKWEGQQWIKIRMFLFTDMLLQTVKEPDGYLCVIQEPIMLADICAMDVQRQHATEFLLYHNVKVSTVGNTKQNLSLRALSMEQKYAWKSLIEQRVFVMCGGLDYYNSTDDVSRGSVTPVVIL